MMRAGLVRGASRPLRLEEVAARVGEGGILAAARLAYAAHGRRVTVALVVLAGVVLLVLVMAAVESGIVM